MKNMICTIILVLIVQLKGSRLLQQTASKGVCPKPLGFGICVERCDNCEANGQLCCSNGCGHVCMDPVFPKPSKCCDPLLGTFPANGVCWEGCACCPDGTWVGSAGDGKTFNCGGVPCSGTDNCGGTVCAPDCSAASCLKPICQLGEVLVTPKGQCCPVCQEAPTTVGCGGIDNCVSYNNGCNVCSCRDNGLEICTLRFCPPEETGEPFCTGCADGYILNKSTKKCNKLCESNGDCDKTNGYRCKNDRICSNKQAAKGQCVPNDVCLKQKGRCASQADCQSGYICIGMIKGRTGFCVDYQ